MEEMYIKPLKVNTLYEYQVQQPNGSGFVLTKNIYVNELLIDWKIILAIESFGENHPNEFPNYPNNNKFRIFVPYGNYVCIGSYNEVSREWAEYKVWLHNNSKEEKISFNLGAKAN